MLDVIVNVGNHMLDVIVTVGIHILDVIVNVSINVFDMIMNVGNFMLDTAVLCCNLDAEKVCVSALRWLWRTRIEQNYDLEFCHGCTRLHWRTKPSCGHVVMELTLWAAHTSVRVLR